jgi:hypothetical protein
MATHPPKTTQSRGTIWGLSRLAKVPILSRNETRSDKRRVLCVNSVNLLSTTSIDRRFADLKDVVADRHMALTALTNLLKPFCKNAFNWRRCLVALGASDTACARVRRFSNSVVELIVSRKEKRRDTSKVVAFRLKNCFEADMANHRHLAFKAEARTRRLFAAALSTLSMPRATDLKERR